MESIGIWWNCTGDQIPVAFCPHEFQGTFWCQFQNEFIPLELVTSGIVVWLRVLAKVKDLMAIGYCGDAAALSCCL
jgi:hypothetical protein